MAKRVVITGSNRGIGLALTAGLIGAGHQVFAGCRNPAAAAELAALQPDAIAAVEMADPTSIEAFARAADRHFGAVDLLINNAGIDARSAGCDFDKRGPMVIEPEAVLEVTRVNAVGPMLLIRHLAPALSRPDQALVINVSSQLGSMVVGDTRGGDAAYNVSKAALNMVSVMMADRLRKHDIAVVALHPGWVRTDMGGERGELAVDEAAPTLVEMFERLTMADTGRFIRPDGSDHPW
ncbi:MAG: SDR family NAD(P)-dependent oxidoreductase [Acidimicrobiia bacterium]|nr:SDR family NAD(P)-dependent oxidoreductase [Acidimicrobiia bacterium]